MCVVLVFNSIDFLEEVADPVYLQSKQREKLKGRLTLPTGRSGRSPRPVTKDCRFTESEA